MGDGAFVAIQTAIMPNLKIQRAIAKSAATLNAFRTADALFLDDFVFIIWVFDKRALNGAGRTKLVFSGGILYFRAGSVIATTQFAIAANLKCMYALYR